MKLTLKRAAVYLGLSTAATYSLVARRVIPHYRLSSTGQRGRGKILLDQADLDAYLQSCRIEAEGQKPSAPSRPRVTQLKHLSLD